MTDDRRPRILVVDDSAVVRRALCSLLTEGGYEPCPAASGEEAFDLCLREAYDIVLTDITMGTLSGVQLCRLLRSDPATAEVPVLLLTAADDPRSRFWGRNAGADGYLAKESVTSDLLPELGRLLKGRAARIAPPRPGRRIDPLSRLSQVLDNLLFRAVVATEARDLVNHVDDRDTFNRAVIDLACDIADYSYLVLRLDGPLGPTVTVHVRGTWPADGEDPSAAFATLGLDGIGSEQITVVRHPKSRPATSVRFGESSTVPLTVAGEQLGSLTVHSGTKRLGGGDIETVAQLAAELGIVVKSLFLMEQTRLLALTDSLTGLANRRHTSETLAQEIQRRERYKPELAVMMCDIDHFKAVNDAFGHNTGDEVLRRISATLQLEARRVDLVGRWGGEEFLLILPSTDREGARILAERIRHRVDHSPPIPNGPERITLSIGVATHGLGETPEELVARADEALYAAKRQGRNRVIVAD